MSSRDRFDACLGRLGATPRETRLARLVTRVYSNQEIADELRFSLSAVKRHLESLYRKMDVRNRRQLAARIRSCLGPRRRGKRAQRRRR